ncbi:MAG: hypothetical protein A2511_09200 [Deltaproteobacteria bacterium RIFOXYD12_FULL_50_9]|nr:MAG: hypothetical protein A2511_09200 [Deltaproteobacteria bacterium RIFOXYD12_FULL_50_9]
MSQASAVKILDSHHGNDTYHSPALVIEYTDPVEGFKGWLVRDTNLHRLCAGGMRVQKDLQVDHLIRMAKNMTLKMRVHNLHVDGAKCGIDFPPDSPQKDAAMLRFINAIKPYLETCYSMGPDLNVEMDELESLAQQLGMPSVKMAIAAAQGWDLPYFSERTAILKQKINGWPLGRLRAGSGVTAAALAVLDFLNIPISKATFCIQGFGALARSTAFTLHLQGGKIKSIADAEKCITAIDRAGLDLKRLLAPRGRSLPDIPTDSAMTFGPPEALWRVPCDILILAAVEHAITVGMDTTLDCKAIVPGANLAITNEAEERLNARGVLVLPDFIPGSGGSLSMEGLYGPSSHPSPTEVLGHIDKKMRRTISEVLALSNRRQISPRTAALDICARYNAPLDTRPYDLS